MIKLLIFCATLCTSLYIVKKPETKERSKEVCERPNIIGEPTKYTGTLKSKPIFMEIEKKEYIYSTGFPTTGEYYKVKLKK